MLQMSTTVKHGYREHAYNELTLTAGLILIPWDFITSCKLVRYNELHL